MSEILPLAVWTQGLMKWPKLIPLMISPTKRT